jgi:predicted TIM-barrel fold metal-dependent hydrolase
MQNQADVSATAAGPDDAVRFPVPAGACDCHVHVFDPARFPYAATRTYTPSGATVAQLQKFSKSLGTSRQVVVLPSVYGFDNRSLEDALVQLGPSVARGVAVIDPEATSDSELDRLHRAGVRAARVNLETRGEKSLATASAAVSRAAQRVAGHKWAVQIFADTPIIAGISDQLAGLPVPVVLDHFAGIKTADGLGQPGFAEVLRLVAKGNVYVKLSAPYRASKMQPRYEDVLPFAKEFVAARPDRMVWASDWPHTGSSGSRGNIEKIEPFRDIDDAHVLGMLSRIASDAATHRAILVDNPARLFGF